MKSKSAQLGFTLVELLVVITVVSLLTTIVITTLNTTQQRKNANNAVRRSTLEKLVSGVESYYGAEGKYPSGTGDTILTSYVSNWPNNTPGNTKYAYATDAGRTYAVIAVPLCDCATYPNPSPVPSGCTRIAKYRSTGAGWGKIQECDWESNPDDTTCNNAYAY
jgi:prepilin-type N-terminal cleavage/methylation domain-containing protein